MRLGVVFPQTEIGTDPGAIREFAQAVEGLGYHHLLIYDHVLGADPTNRPGWRGYTLGDMFHEPFVLFGYLAGCTTRLELTTGIIILPQRQTALVAKQAAEVDVLSVGRLRLGVAVGWNPVEYEALGEDFHTRGRRVAEQIRVMRALWTQEIVTFRGRWHNIVEAGLNPLPVQRPIPVWMGGYAEPALRRIGRVADGWIGSGRVPSGPRETAERLREYTKAAGRDPAVFGIEAQVSIAGRTPDEWRAVVQEWRAAGATHVTVSTMRAGLMSVGAHLDAVRRFIESVKP
jgi:probable F420-dependent oxidoreductase